MQHGSTGVWFFTEGMSAAQAAEFARRVEALGYTHLWLPETTGRDPFAHIAFLAAHTERLAFATGIANIYHRHPGPMRQAAYTLAEQSGDRFLLGLGVSHAPLVAGLRGLEYKSPVATMREYLERMNASPYSGPQPAQAPRTVIAALGPKMLALAREKTDGAHPYWTTPEHTQQARAILGPDKLLCVEQKVCLESDAARARGAGRAALRIYASLPNYRNNWLRMGFAESDLAGGGSDRLIDALVAWGDAKAIRDRLQAHRDAGATHVCIQPLKSEGRMGEADWRALEELAPR
jgi:probable F420-dependent oxidoreductase